MIALIPWKLREFTFDLPVDAFPGILERLRGTVVRTADLVAGVPEELLGTRIDGKWSAKENIGHLVDLADLDDRRLSEFLAGSRSLSPAEASNRATEMAGHNRVPIAVILDRLRTLRNELLGKLALLTEEQIALEAMQPRLQQKMRVVDWTYFIAEHDDHHLALAQEMIVQADTWSNNQQTAAHDGN